MTNEPKTPLFKAGDVVQHKISKELAIVTKSYQHKGEDLISVSIGVALEYTMLALCFELADKAE